MSDNEFASEGELVGLTAEIVSAYIGNNSVQRGDIAEVIRSVHAALANLGTPKLEPAAERPIPPISIKRSVTPDFLISMEDGKRYKSLKRHLAGKGLTPEQYREKWGLPRDYPMTAPNYSAQRSELARAAGLGRKPNVEAEPAPAAAKRTRKKSA
jgi:predicted transcriptional regulator